MKNNQKQTFSRKKKPNIYFSFKKTKKTKQYNIQKNNITTIDFNNIKKQQQQNRKQKNTLLWVLLHTVPHFGPRIAGSYIVYALLQKLGG